MMVLIAKMELFWCLHSPLLTQEFVYFILKTSAMLSQRNRAMPV